MKKTILVAIGALLIFASCETLQENLAARRNLEKCKYEFKGVVIKRVRLERLSLKSIDVDVLLKVTNTTKSVVVMDKIEGDLYLDQHKTANLRNNTFVRIQPSKSKTVTIASELPFSSVLKALGRKPTNIIVDSKFYVNILIGGYTIGSPIPIRIKKTIPIPYRTITNLAQREARRIGGSLLRNLF